MFSRLEQRTPASVSSGGYAMAWKWKVRYAILRWVGFQAKHVFYYLILAAILYSLEEIRMLMWATWYIFSGMDAPLIPM